MEATDAAVSIWDLGLAIEEWNNGVSMKQQKRKVEDDGWRIEQSNWYYAKIETQ